MRQYCRVFHTSLDSLMSMPMGQLMVELRDASLDLEEEARKRQKDEMARAAKMKTGRKARPRRRR